MKLRFLWALVLMMSIMLTASAQTPATSTAERNGYAALKNFLEAPASKADCISQIQVILHNPYIHGEFKSRGLERPNQQSEIDKGSLSVNLAAMGNLVTFDLPFYIVEDADNFSLYFNFNDAWKKISIDGINVNDLAENNPSAVLGMVDRAVLIDDDKNQQVIRIAFDCKKLAEFVAEQKTQVDPESKEGKESAAATKCLTDALIKTGTIESTLSINKMTNQPLLFEVDLSKAVSNLMLELSTQEEVQKQGAAELLKELAASTKLQMFAACDYSGAFDEKEFELPKKVRKAEDITKDLFALAKIGSTKTQ